MVTAIQTIQRNLQTTRSSEISLSDSFEALHSPKNAPPRPLTLKGASNNHQDIGILPEKSDHKKIGHKNIQEQKGRNKSALFSTYGSTQQLSRAGSHLAHENCPLSYEEPTSDTLLHCGYPHPSCFSQSHASDPWDHWRGWHHAIFSAD